MTKIAAASRLAMKDGELIAEENATLHVLSPALIKGQVITDTTRTYSGKWWKLQDHLDRLFEGAIQLGISTRASKACLERWANELLDQNRQQEPSTVEWQVRFILTNSSPAHKGSGHSLIVVTPLLWHNQDLACDYIDGASIWLVKQPQIPRSIVPAQIKSRGRIDYLLASMELSTSNKKGSALMRDSCGLIAETTGRNIFVISDGCIITPLSKEIVPGLVRGELMKMSNEIGITLKEADISLDLLLSAEEIFLSSTVCGITHVSKIEDRLIGNGAMGPITKKIIESFSLRVSCWFHPLVQP